MDVRLIPVISVEGKYFLDESICRQNQVGDETVYIIHDDTVYNFVSPEEIAKVCEKNFSSFSVENNPNLQIYVDIPEEEPDNDFIVCCYQDRYFVLPDILQKFHLHSDGGKARVNGKIYYEITPQQIAIIEGSSIYGIWKAVYREIVANKS